MSANHPKTFFFIVSFWYLKLFNKVFNKLINSYYNVVDFINYCNDILYPDLSYSEKNVNQDQEQPHNAKTLIKYDDKYKIELDKMDEYEFDPELLTQKKNEYKHKMSIDIENEINEIREKIIHIDCLLMSENDEKRVETYLLNKEDLFAKEIKLFNQKEQLDLLSLEEATKYVTNQHLKRLQNCFVMEYTPHGNVLMVYDIERETFRYYSDNAIPYRFLEVVARKYAKQFNCKSVYIDMEKELKLAEELKLIEQNRLIEKAATMKSTNSIENKKSVFAKFKSYNTSTGSVNTAVPPKNSISNNNLTTNNNNYTIKDKSNRYTYEGKIVNFSFIKKIDRKIVDKKLSVSFTEFKNILLKKV